MSNSKDSNNSATFQSIVTRLTELKLEPSGRVWIAYSGGADSSVLLNCASAAFDKSLLKVVHIHHGLSNNADAWEEHCRQSAAAFGLPFIAKRVSLKSGNVEAVGRRARYDTFNELAKPGDIVLTAHHADDETESLIWQLTTGRALIGISEWLTLANCRVWRPLLTFNKSELLAVATKMGLRWVEDDSNLCMQFTRNAIRHKIVPKLRRDDEHFDETLRSLKRRPLAKIPRKPVSVELIENSPFFLRSWLNAYSITPKELVVEEILRQCSGRADSNMEIRVSPQAAVRRFCNYLYVVTDHLKAMPKQIAAGDNLDFELGQMAWQPTHRGIQTGRLLLVRHRQGGESLTVDGKSVKLSKWFYESAIPPWQRDRWPLLYSGSVLAAVPGLGVDDGVAMVGGCTPDWRPTE